MKTWIICALAITLAACGGGGGGGSGGGNGSNASTGVRVIHASIDGSPVDILSSAKAEGVVQSAHFGESTFYASLATGPQTLTLSIAGRPNRSVDTFSVDVQKLERRSILLFGGNDTVPLQASIFVDSAGAIPDGQGALRVADGMFGASALDLVVDGQLVSQAAYGSVSSYAILTPGPHAVELKRSSDGRKVYSGTVAVNSGDTFTLAAGGEIDYFTSVNLLED